MSTSHIGGKSPPDITHCYWTDATLILGDCQRCCSKQISSNWKWSLAFQKKVDEVSDGYRLLCWLVVNKSFRCYGLRPSVSAADPFGKDAMVVLTVCGKTWSGWVTDDGAGRWSTETVGCRRINSANVAPSGTARLKHSSRTAPLRSPSSCLAAAIEAAIWSPDIFNMADLMCGADGQLDGSGLMPSS